MLGALARVLGALARLLGALARVLGALARAAVTLAISLSSTEFLSSSSRCRVCQLWRKEG